MFRIEKITKSTFLSLVLLTFFQCISLQINKNFLLYWCLSQEKVEVWKFHGLKIFLTIWYSYNIWWYHISNSVHQLSVYYGNIFPTTHLWVIFMIWGDDVVDTSFQVVGACFVVCPCVVMNQYIILPDKPSTISNFLIPHIAYTEYLKIDMTYETRKTCNLSHYYQSVSTHVSDLIMLVKIRVEVGWW